MHKEVATTSALSLFFGSRPRIQGMLGWAQKLGGSGDNYLERHKILCGNREANTCWIEGNGWSWNELANVATSERHLRAVELEAQNQQCSHQERLLGSSVESLLQVVARHCGNEQLWRSCNPQLTQRERLPTRSSEEVRLWVHAKVNQSRSLAKASRLLCGDQPDGLTGDRISEQRRFTDQGPILKGSNGFWWEAVGPV